MVVRFMVVCVPSSSGPNRRADTAPSILQISGAPVLIRTTGRM
jgi:hypothetical protein